MTYVRFTANVQYVVRKQQGVYLDRADTKEMVRSGIHECINITVSGV